jgi:hypothetical protein
MTFDDDDFSGFACNKGPSKDISLAGNHVRDQAYQFADPNGSLALGKRQRQDFMSISKQPDDLAKDTCDYDSHTGNHKIPTKG